MDHPCSLVVSPLVRDHCSSFVVPGSRLTVGETGDGVYSTFMEWQDERWVLGCGHERVRCRASTGKDWATGRAGARPPDLFAGGRRWLLPGWCRTTRRPAGGRSIRRRCWSPATTKSRSWSCRRRCWHTSTSPMMSTSSPTSPGPTEGIDNPRGDWRRSEPEPRFGSNLFTPTEGTRNCSLPSGREPVRPGACSASTANRTSRYLRLPSCSSCAMWHRT